MLERRWRRGESKRKHLPLPEPASGDNNTFFLSFRIEWDLPIARYKVKSGEKFTPSWGVKTLIASRERVSILSCYSIQPTTVHAEVPTIVSFLNQHNRTQPVGICSLDEVFNKQVIDFQPLLLSFFQAFWVYWNSVWEQRSWMLNQICLSCVTGSSTEYIWVCDQRDFNRLNISEYVIRIYLITYSDIFSRTFSDVGRIDLLEYSILWESLSHIPEWPPWTTVRGELACHCQNMLSAVNSIPPDELNFPAATLQVALPIGNLDTCTCSSG